MDQNNAYIIMLFYLFGGIIFGCLFGISAGIKRDVFGVIQEPKINTSDVVVFNVLIVIVTGLAIPSLGYSIIALHIVGFIFFICMFLVTKHSPE